MLDGCLSIDRLTVLFQVSKRRWSTLLQNTIFCQHVADFAEITLRMAGLCECQNKESVRRIFIKGIDHSYYKGYTTFKTENL